MLDETKIFTWVGLCILAKIVNVLENGIKQNADATICYKNIEENFKNDILLIIRQALFLLIYYIHVKCVVGYNL